MKIYKMTIVALAAFFSFGCGAVATQKTPTPTDILKSFVEASKNKDIETVKKSLSKGTLGIIEESAKAKNTTVDELLKKDTGIPVKELPETRNEKIKGDTGSVEVKNIISGEFDTIPFVKEDGGWKIALDKFIRDLEKKALDQMKTPPADMNSEAPKPDGDQQPKSDSSKPKTDK